MERAKAGCLQSSVLVCEAVTLLQVKIVHELLAWIQFSVHTFQK